MGTAITTEHRELATVARQLLAREDALKAARAALDGDGVGPPAFWPLLVELGWLGLHVPERLGGSGFGAAELVVVAEELGRVCAPGPFLPSVVAAGALAAAPADQAGSASDLVSGILAGTTRAAIALWGTAALVAGRLEGSLGPVLGEPDPDVLVVTVGDELAVVDGTAVAGLLSTRRALDPTQPVLLGGVASGLTPAAVVCDGAALARSLASLVVAAFAAGGAAACRDMAVSYACDRVAFGRPIAHFQAIKHRCADMLVDEHLASAATWEAARRAAGQGARSRACDAAVTVAVAAYLRNAKRNIQVHGGIGFTWEHDAHLHLRRAGALAALVGDTHAVPLDDVVALLEEPTGLELGPAAQPARDRIRAVVDRYRALDDPTARHALFVEEGLQFPHWPRPYGRDAGPVEQLVIDEELEGVERPTTGPTAWTIPIVLPTLMVHGTDEQRERWILPTLRGDVMWCQLFSEPGAGSDLAALTTRAERTDGGWLVTGQKVWTSHAQHAELGFALVRTDRTAARHRGITCLAIDMHAPGVTVRPLRQITGALEFNEVFLDEVFVPDDDVIGPVDDGWRVGRTTLTNERVSLGEGVGAMAAVLRQIAAVAEGQTAPDVRRDLREHACTAFAVRAANLKAAAAAVAGADPGPEGNVTKLTVAELAQRISDTGLAALGPSALFADGTGAVLSGLFLQSRMATIAGGTSEIVRNVIAERILGLPRDQEPA